MESHLIDVRPVNPVAPYLGGKRNLAGRICALLREIPHYTYVEPFVGMGGIFLRRERRPKAEVINDLSGDVANLYRVARRHYQPLVEEFDWIVSSRVEFDRQRKVDPTTLTDIERAARFLYLQRIAFGGKVTGRTFGVSPREPSLLRVANLRADLRRLRDRLETVTIEQLPYSDVIRRYDTSETLFYLDPPYWGCEGDYGDDFTRADFQRLADQLAGIQGGFLLSINDTPGAREVFAPFSIESVPVTYTIGTANGAGQRAGELIVRGGFAEQVTVRLL
jgi:DNA adenine methylase